MTNTLISRLVLLASLKFCFADLFLSDLKSLIRAGTFRCEFFLVVELLAMSIETRCWLISVAADRGFGLTGSPLVVWEGSLEDLCVFSTEEYTGIGGIALDVATLHEPSGIQYTYS